MLKNTFKKLKIGLLATAMLLGLAAAPLASSGTVSAAPARDAVCDGVSSASGEAGCDGSGLSTLIKNVINILLFIIGTIAVIMIIVGGIRYATSGGDQAQVTAAKNTILYSVVGVVVALMAFAIVNFVIGALG